MDYAKNISQSSAIGVRRLPNRDSIAITNRVSIEVHDADQLSQLIELLMVTADQLGWNTKEARKYVKSW